jgi:hypothetical protein
VLQLRVYADSRALVAVVDRLELLTGAARHVSLVESGSGRRSLVSADLRADAADPALTTLRELGVSGDDIALVRLDTISPEGGTSESSALIWADVLGRARTQARAPGRYLVLMAAAGVIAAWRSSTTARR